MKKAFIVFLLLIVLVLLFTIVSFAATYSDTFDFNLSQDYDFSVSVLTMEYETGGWFTRAKASTTVSTTNEETGYVYVHIRNADGEMADSRKDFGEGNSSVNSGNASLSGTDTFVRILHYALKTDPDISRDWEYIIY